MSKSGLWVIAGIFLVTLFALVYLAFTYDTPAGTTTVVLPNPTEQPVPESEAREQERSTSTLPSILLEPESEPAIAETEPEVAPAPEAVESPDPETAEALASESAEANEEVVQLPSLNDSDSFVLERLQALQNGAALVERLADQQLVRRFVVLVDNLSQANLPQTDLPYRPLAGEMPVRAIDENLFLMDEQSYARFDEVIDTFIAIDSDAAMALYRTLSPLFQRAYSELGYGSADFDDTLRRAIDNVLETSRMEGPFQLIKPSVMYVYADARIEELSDLHKQLLRLGPDNTRALKEKLREFSGQL